MSFVSRSAAVQNNIRSRYSRRMVPISRSMKGCESGTYGTLLISITSKIRRLADEPREVIGRALAAPLSTPAENSPVRRSKILPAAFPVYTSFLAVGMVRHGTVKSTRRPTQSLNPPECIPGLICVMPIPPPVLDWILESELLGGVSFA